MYPIRVQLNGAPNAADVVILWTGAGQGMKLFVQPFGITGEFFVQYYQGQALLSETKFSPLKVGFFVTEVPSATLVRLATYQALDVLILDASGIS